MTDRTNLISLDNLPNSIFIGINDEFRKKLFDRARYNAGGEWKKLAKIFNMHDSHVIEIKNGFRNRKGIREEALASSHMIRNISKLSEIPYSDIEKNIKYMRGKHHQLIPVKLPVVSSAALARLVAHAMGDGHISKRANQFQYSNTRKELVESVRKDVVKVFGKNLNTGTEVITVTNKVKTMITFSNVIGKLLILCGAPDGKKTEKQYFIPDWILNGSNEIKSAFLQALFDDEGTVCYKHNNIRICFDKKTQIAENLNEFLEHTRKMLIGLGVSPDAVRKMRSRKERDRICLGFGITGQYQIKTFKEKVSFIHMLKKERIVALVSRKFNKQYKKGEIQQIILKEFDNKDVLKSKDLSIRFDRSQITMRKHLNNLQRMGTIERIGSNKKSVWRLNDVRTSLS
ncbi:MAG: hypothetical protein KJ906_01280 [Nanoarchaeota archaeon]|nr:hypothetical protein [Nanoarchaeota archaeon]